MTKQEFISKYWAGAQAACAGKGIFPILALSEGAVESGWGSSLLSTAANNFFGTKSTTSWEESGGKFIEMNTREVVHGGTEYIKAKFRKYDSPEQSFENYVHFVTQPHYVAAGVLEAKTPEDQIRCIAKAGYATDPHYADTIISVMHGLQPLIETSI